MAGVDARSLVHDATEARDALLEHARSVSESHVFGRTGRPGWTLKHELASVIAADGELAHVFGELARGRALHEGLDLRRRFAQAMHTVQELRLSRLVERLEDGGAAFVRHIDDHSDLLGRPLELAGHEARSLGELAHAHVERLRTAVHTFEEHGRR